LITETVQQMKNKSYTVKRRDEKILEFEKSLYNELGYVLCSKYIPDRRCDAGEGCAHLRDVMGIRLCWTK
jgi:hypothetical protein